MNVPHRSNSNIGGQGSPLEELDTLAVLSSEDLMGLEEAQEAGHFDVHLVSTTYCKRVAIVRGGVTSPRRLFF